MLINTMFIIPPIPDPHITGILIPVFAILMPVFIVLIVFIYESRNKKNKYDAIIEVSKNIKDGEKYKK